VAYVLEGGYDTAALAQSVAQIIEAHHGKATGTGDAQAQAIPASQRAILNTIDRVLKD
jgi:acetoin utilization deacetylase AcuC-like enzyme